MMLLPTRFVIASTTPALVLITDWSTKFTRSASSCTLVQEVIGGGPKYPLLSTLSLDLSFFWATLMIDTTVLALVELTLVK